MRIYMCALITYAHPPIDIDVPANHFVRRLRMEAKVDPGEAYRSYRLKIKATKERESLIRNVNLGEAEGEAGEANEAEEAGEAGEADGKMTTTAPWSYNGGASPRSGTEPKCKTYLTSRSPYSLNKATEGSDTVYVTIATKLDQVDNGHRQYTTARFIGPLTEFHW